jgi:YD repeat-containing protein
MKSLRHSLRASRFPSANDHGSPSDLGHGRIYWRVSGCVTGRSQEPKEGDMKQLHGTSPVPITIAGFLLVLLYGPPGLFSQEYTCPNEAPVCVHTPDGTCNPHATWTKPCGCGGSDLSTYTNFFPNYCGDVGVGGGLCPDQQPGCTVTCHLSILPTPCFPLAEPVENHKQTKEQGPDDPPQECMGQPVSLTTGAMFLTHIDAVVGDLVFSRTFHSLRMGNTNQGPPSFGAFGPGWNASVEKRLTSSGPRFTAARNEDGNPQYYFDSSGSGVLRSVVPSSVDSWITTTSCPGGQPPGYHGGVCWKRYFRRGGSETYWAEIDWSRAYILSATDPSGNLTTYVYDYAKRLVSVGRLGRSLVLTYPEFSTQPYQPHQLLDGNGTVLATYAYTGAFLSSVTYADGSGYQYQPDGSSPARIAAVTDHAERRSRPTSTIRTAGPRPLRLATVSRSSPSSGASPSRPRRIWATAPASSSRQSRTRSRTPATTLRSTSSRPEEELGGSPTPQVPVPAEEARPQRDPGNTTEPETS